MIQKITRLFISALLLLFGNQAFTQENELEIIDKDVIVLKPYAPSISDAIKLSNMPRTKDTAKIDINFDYQIFPRQINTSYELKPVPAAKMKGEPLTKLYGNYLKLGFGTNLSPLAELSINNLRSKKYSIGAFVRHYSVNGKTKVDEQTYYPNFSKNSLKLYGKKFYSKAALFANIHFQTNKNLIYGYPANSENIIEKEELEFNRFSTIGFSTRYKTNISQKSKLNYDLKFGYSYFQDNENSNENNFLFHSNFNKKHFKGTVDMNVELESYIINPLAFVTEQMEFDSSKLTNTVLNINPNYSKSGKEWRYSIGFDFVSLFDPAADAEFHFYPNLKFEYKLVENFIISYFKYNGSFDVNSLQKLSSTNPFISMEMNHKNTNIKKNIFAGVKGNISSKIAFDVSANFKEVENMVFFENLCENNQRFQLVYKNVDYGTFHGELLYEKNDYLDFSIEGNIYTYNIEIEELSHIPKFDAQITARYNLQNKIILSSDIFFIGKRYANIYAANCNTAQTLMALSPIELDGTVDFNLGVEYFKNKNLSAFLKFNNIFAKKYFYWNQYPGQGFNVMAGVNFSF